MPKAMLKFDLNDPDICDALTFRRAVKADCLASSLSDFKECLRSFLKYGESSEEAHKAVQAMQDRFFEILKDNNIDMEDLEI